MLERVVKMEASLEGKDSPTARIILTHFARCIIGYNFFDQVN